MCHIAVPKQLTKTNKALLLFHTSRARPARRSNMSWMDSWSRPSKQQATPAPFYLIPGAQDTPYCHSCGRVIGARRTEKTTVKYCSSRCRSHKPGKLDKEIERVFVALLDGTAEGEQGPGGGAPRGDKAPKAKKRAEAAKKKAKGDARILVSCDEVEKRLFGHEDHDDGDTAGSATSGGSQHGDEDETLFSPSSHAPQTTQNNYPYDDDPFTGTLDDPTGGGYIDGDILARLSVRSGTRIRPPQAVSQVNGSVGGEKGKAERIEETEAMLAKRRAGQRRARHREMVRCAARRGVVFGFGQGGGEDENNRERRKCEAVMLGKVVEPSFAKGDWSIRWREG